MESGIYYNKITILFEVKDFLKYFAKGGSNKK